MVLMLLVLMICLNGIFKTNYYGRSPCGQGKKTDLQKCGTLKHVLLHFPYNTALQDAKKELAVLKGKG